MFTPDGAFEQPADIADAGKMVCACPDWWKNQGPRPRAYYVNGGGAELRGPHHHDSCALHAREAEAPRVRCTCDSYHVQTTTKFNSEIANEAHEKACPMYRAGAHFWPIPATTTTGAYDATCPWCGETKTLNPYANDAAMAQAVPMGGSNSDPQPATMRRGNKKEKAT